MVSLQTVAPRVVVDDTTLRVDSTKARTWILALLVDTSKGWSAFRIGDAFRSALNGRVSTIVRQAGAHGCVVRLSALGVLATRRWHAGVRVLRLTRWRRLWNWSAGGERISGVSRRAVAHDDAVRHMTFGSRATLARARVPALVVVVAVLVPPTVRIQNTLGLAPDVRISEVFVTTDAYSNTVLVVAIGVCSAG